MNKALRRVLPYLGLAGMMENMGDMDLPDGDDVAYKGPPNFPPRDPLTKKQKKRRVRAKMAKQSRKVNYRKARLKRKRKK